MAYCNIKEFSIYYVATLLIIAVSSKKVNKFSEILNLLVC